MDGFKKISFITNNIYILSLLKMKRKTVSPTQVRLLDPREKSGYREAFKSIPRGSSYHKEYYERNKERLCANQKAYYERKKRREKANKYYAEHKEHLRELQKQSRLRRERRNRLSQSFFGRIRLKIECVFDKKHKCQTKN